MTDDCTPDWTLHPQLAGDCEIIGDLPLSRLLVSRDANYPWLILAPRRLNVSEIIDLDAAAQAQLMNEIVRTGKALKKSTICDKLNIAAIGTVVPQLHVHIVARRRGDAAWPLPVWGRVAAKTYDRAELSAFVGRIREEIGL